MPLLFLMIISGTIPLVAYYFFALVWKDSISTHYQMVLLKGAILCYLFPFQAIALLFWDKFLRFRKLLGLQSLEEIKYLSGYFCTVPWLGYKLLIRKEIVISAIAVASCAFVLFFLKWILYLVEKNKLKKNSIVVEAKNEKIIVLKNEFIKTPITIGLIRPAIIFPTYDYTDQAVQFILSHEKIHICQHDIFWKYLCIVLCAFYWYLPFPYMVTKEYGILCELRCDELCTAHMSQSQKKAYAILIVNHAAGNNISDFTASFFNEKGLTERRIKTMFHKKIHRPILAVLTVLPFILSSFTVLAYQSPMTTDDQQDIDDYVIYDYENGDSDNMCLDIDEYSNCDFSVSNLWFTEENGYAFPCEPQLMTIDKTCNHSYKKGTATYHKKDQSGGCTVSQYHSKICKKCRKIVKGSLIKSTYYSKCPH